MLRYNKKKRCCDAPYSVNISVTERCPLRCKFCFQKYNHTNELDYPKVCKYIDELSLLGTVQVQFSGGEPLVYPYLTEVISYAHSKGLHTMISSSGVGMTNELAHKLKIAGLDCCYISLNGSMAEIHELTREGFNSAMQALEILYGAELKTAINWVAYHDNVRDLPQLVTIAKAFNVKYISVLPMKKNNSNMILNQLDKMDFIELVRYCKEYKEYLVVDSCFKELNVAIKGNRFLADGCRAGIFYMAINALGEFLQCPHQVDKGIQYPSISEYWNEDKVLREHRMHRECPYLCQIVDKN